MGPAVDGERVAIAELAAPPQLNGPVDRHLARLHPQLGLSPRGHQAPPFQVLIESHRFRRSMGPRLLPA
mgnify:CR=1 FL=1